VVATGHGRRVHLLHNIPCFGRPVLVRWLKRIWRCEEPTCEVDTWSETHGFAKPRSKLTTRAVGWAVDGLRHDDTTVSALARHLGVDWHTAWNAIKVEATKRVKRPERDKGVTALGVDEHIWRPGMRGKNRAVTVMVDLTRDDRGCLHARSLDAVEGRTGTVYADWLKEQGLEVTVTVEHAALDPFRGYANAIRDELPYAVAVLDASMWSNSGLCVGVQASVGSNPQRLVRPCRPVNRNCRDEDSYARPDLPHRRQFRRMRPS
jgi:transposase